MHSAKGQKRSFDKLRTSASGNLRVCSDVLEAMRALAKQAHPQEACAILRGETGEAGRTGEGRDRITQCQPAENVHPKPETHFEIDPQALIDAHRQAREGGPQVLGYFHSHPSGAARPSATDAEMAAGDRAIWAIAGKDELTFWRSTPDGFAPLSYRVDAD